MSNAAVSVFLSSEHRWSPLESIAPLHKQNLYLPPPLLFSHTLCPFLFVCLFLSHSKIAPPAINEFWPIFASWPFCWPYNMIGRGLWRSKNNKWQADQAIQELTTLKGSDLEYSVAAHTCHTWTLSLLHPLSLACPWCSPIFFFLHDIASVSCQVAEVEKKKQKKVNFLIFSSCLLPVSWFLFFYSQAVLTKGLPMWLSIPVRRRPAGALLLQ